MPRTKYFTPLEESAPEGQMHDRWNFTGNEDFWNRVAHEARLELLRSQRAVVRQRERRATAMKIPRGYANGGNDARVGSATGES